MDEFAQNQNWSLLIGYQFIERNVLFKSLQYGFSLHNTIHSLMAFSLFIPVGQSVKMGVVEQAVVAVTPRKCLKEAQYVPGAGGDA